MLTLNPDRTVRQLVYLWPEWYFLAVHEQGQIHLLSEKNRAYNSEPGDYWDWRDTGMLPP